MATQRLLATDLNGIYFDTVLRDVPGAVTHPEECQSRSKQSPLVEDGAEARSAKVPSELEEWVGDAMGTRSPGKILDLLPVRSVEAGAIRSPAESCGASPGTVTVADTTGNDLDMMRPDFEIRPIAGGDASMKRSERRLPSVRNAIAPFSAVGQRGLHDHGTLTEQAACIGSEISPTERCSDDQY